MESCDIKLKIRIQYSKTLVKLHKKQTLSLETKLKTCEIELKCLKSTKND